MHLHTYIHIHIYTHIYIYEKNHKHAFKAFLLLSRSFPLQSDSDVPRHVKAWGQNSLQLRCANIAVSSPSLHFYNISASEVNNCCTSGWRKALGKSDRFCSQGVGDCKASHCNEISLVYHYILYFGVLVYSYHTLSGAAVPPFPMEEAVPALSLCSSSAICSLTQGTLLCFTAWQNLPW